MALIKCSECGKEISDKAKVCVNCGCPIENKECKKDSKHLILNFSIKKTILSYLCLAILFVFVSLFVLNLSFGDTFGTLLMISIIFVCILIPMIIIKKVKLKNNNDIIKNVKNIVLIKCSVCGKEISNNAKTCPNCGDIKKISKPMTKLDKIFVPIIAITVTVGIISLCMTPKFVERTYPNARIETFGEEAFIIVNGKMEPNPNYNQKYILGNEEINYSKAIILGTFSVLVPTITIITFLILKKKESKSI